VKETGIRILFAGIVLAASVRIVSTYGVFSQAWDEPFHVACGMEWLDLGTYEYETLHPPLARVMAAVGPYLGGARSFHEKYMWDEGNSILSSGAGYDRNLFLARAGTLPFFLVAAGVVFAWARRLYDGNVAILAALLFTSLPPVLAHAGLATTDMAMTATFAGLVYALTLWLERPTGIRSAASGLALGAATLSKFSTLVFLPVCGALILACRMVSRHGDPAERTAPDVSWTKRLAIILGLGFFLVWGGYRFSTGSISDPALRPHASIDKFAGKSGAVHDLAYAVAESTIYPMPEFFRGINFVRMKGQDGQRGQYLFGEVRVKSWWYYFFVVLAFKTPLPYLLLSLYGAAILARRWNVDKDWRPMVPLLCTLGILAACIPSNIKLGVRHILPVYPFLSVFAAAGAASLWRHDAFRLVGRTTAAGLILWQVASGMIAHPDYLPYFNELAGKHPERILGDSDLDWGLDIKRLQRKLNDMGVREVSVAVATSADLNRFFPPRMKPLKPYERKSGWVAVSLFRLEYDFSHSPPYKGFAWLGAYEPVAMAGRTIRILHIPDGGVTIGDTAGRGARASRPVAPARIGDPVPR